MLGQAKVVDCDTSETSSYDDSDGEPAKVKKQKPIEDSDGEDNSTYNKFKTQNEVEIGEAYKTGPVRLQLDDMDEIVPFGHIV